MCMWAGYVGNRHAAAVLLEMERRQEGWCGSYYSGLVTLDNDGFYHDKLIGNMADLVSRTGVEKFPGTTGLVHSRTNSGGDREWGHPFVGGNEEAMIVAQGSCGFFPDNADRVALGDELLDAGFEFRSAFSGKLGTYPQLKNGNSVHTSEIFAHAFAYFFRRFGDAKEAIRETFRRVHGESVFAAIFRNIPGAIFVANVNQRVVMACDKDGLYMASSSVAIPENALWRLELPANTIAVARQMKVEMEYLLAAAELEIDDMFPPGLETAFLEYVKNHPGQPLEHVADALCLLFRGKPLARCAVAAYQTAERLLAAGAIHIKVNAVPGVNNVGSVPQVVFFTGIGK